jgi:putative membrane protein
MVLMMVIQPEESRIIFSQVSAGLAILFFLAGALAAAAMIIPGVSGSFLLVALGVYYPVVSAVSRALDAVLMFVRGGYSGLDVFFDQIALPFWTLFPFGIGVLGGLFAGAALVRLLLKKAAALTYGAILGLVLGSAPVVFPRDGFDSVPLIVISFVCILAGGAVSFLFSREAR